MISKMTDNIIFILLCMVGSLEVTALASHKLLSTVEGCNATLVCTFPTAAGNNRSQTWKNESSGQRLEGSRYVVTSGLTYSAITIMKTLPEESGNYSYGATPDCLVTLTVDPLPKCVNLHNHYDCELSVSGGNPCADSWITTYCQLSCGLCPRANCTKTELPTELPTGSSQVSQQHVTSISIMQSISTSQYVKATSSHISVISNLQTESTRSSVSFSTPSSPTLSSFNTFTPSGIEKTPNNENGSNITTSSRWQTQVMLSSFNTSTPSGIEKTPNNKNGSNITTSSCWQTQVMLSSFNTSTPSGIEKTPNNENGSNITTSSCWQTQVMLSSFNTSTPSGVEKTLNNENGSNIITSLCWQIQVMLFLSVFVAAM